MNTSKELGMTVVQISQAPDRAAYEAVRAALPTEPPAGLLLHTAHELPDGKVQLVDVYRSAHDLRAFVEGTLFPAFERTGHLPHVTAQPRPVPHEAFFVQTPEGRA